MSASEAKAATIGNRCHVAEVQKRKQWGRKLSPTNLTHQIAKERRFAGVTATKTYPRSAKAQEAKHDFYLLPDCMRICWSWQRLSQSIPGKCPDKDCKFRLIDTDCGLRR